MVFWRHGKIKNMMIMTLSSHVAYLKGNKFHCRTFLTLADPPPDLSNNQSLTSKSSSHLLYGLSRKASFRGEALRDALNNGCEVDLVSLKTAHVPILFRKMPAKAMIVTWRQAESVSLRLSQGVLQHNSLYCISLLFLHHKKSKVTFIRKKKLQIH